MQDPRPRPELHHGDPETIAGVTLFAGLVVLGGVALVRSHPLAAACLAFVAAGVVASAVRLRGWWRDRRAAREDPPAPGVIVGHLKGEWRGARPRPYRLPWAAFQQHVVVAGPTGRGKSFTFVEPFLRAHLGRSGTGVFYLDGKGDAIHEGAGIAFDHVFYPERPSESACWNPLAGPDPIEAAGLFAAALFPEAAMPETNGSFYAARAVHAITRVAPAMAFTGHGTGLRPEPPRAALTDADAAAKLAGEGIDTEVADGLVRDKGPELVARALDFYDAQPPNKQTPEFLVDAVEREHHRSPKLEPTYEITPAQLNRVLFSADGLGELAVALDGDRQRCVDPVRHDLLAQLHHEVDALMQLPARERGSVFQTLQNRLGYFLEPPFHQLCSRSDFSLAHVADGARVAFLLPTGRFPNAAKPLGRVALSQFKNAVLASAPDREKIAVLDEFHNFVSSDFAAFLSQARSRGGGAIMAVQSLSDLPRDQADAMLANVSTAIVTPGCRPADAAYWADAFGKEPQQRHAISYELPGALELRPRPTVRTHLIEDYRYTPTEIAELREGFALIQVTAGRRSWPVARVDVERRKRPRHG